MMLCRRSPPYRRSECGCASAEGFFSLDRYYRYADTLPPARRDQDARRCGTSAAGANQSQGTLAQCRSGT